MYAREDLRRDAASLRYTQSSSILFEVLNESSLLLSEVEPLGPLRRRSGVLLARSKQILRNGTRCRCRWWSWMRGDGEGAYQRRYQGGIALTNFLLIGRRKEVPQNEHVFQNFIAMNFRKKQGRLKLYQSFYIDDVFQSREESQLVWPFVIAHVRA